MAFQGVARDVTERKQLENQLRQAQKMESIGTWASGIAHDFNNLMTVVTGYSELALRGLELQIQFGPKSKRSRRLASARLL